MGRRGDSIYVPLFEYYENEVIPEKLNKFISTSKNYKKSLEYADLSEKELEIYYELGKSGDERFNAFYDEFYDIKKGTYISNIEKGRSHNIAMKESRLTQEEYEENKEEFERLIRKIRFRLVLESIANNKTSTVAARNAGCTVEEIYEWYFKGRDGDEEYKDFYEHFHKGYVRPSAVPAQEKLDNENASLDGIIRSNKHLFTKKDIDIWLKNGIIKVNVVNLEKPHEEDDDEEENNNDIKEISLNKFRKTKKSRSTLGKIINEDYDIEELKKQILGN